MTHKLSEQHLQHVRALSRVPPSYFSKQPDEMRLQAVGQLKHTEDCEKEFS